MLITALPYPGAISSGLGLRRECLKAINAVEAQADLYPGGKAPQAKQISEFFAACKAAVDAKADTTLPVINARSIAAAKPNEVVLTMSEQMDSSVAPAASAFALANPARTVVGISISGSTVRLQVNTPYAVGDTAPTLAYTVPATNGLRDLSGNLLAASAATAITRV